MTKLVFGPSALADIDDIWDYTVEKWGEDQAERYVDQIQAVSKDIADGSRSLRQLPEVPKIDGFARCEHHYIFVLRDPETTSVVAVLHESMDMISRLKRLLAD